MTVRYVPKGTTNLSGLGTIADTDDVIFGEGGQIVNNGLDFTAFTEGLHNLVTDPRFSGDIGIPGTPLQCDFDSGTNPTLIHAGSGRIYYEPKGDNNLCSRIWNLGSGKIILSGTGTVTSIESAGGLVTIPAGLTVTNIRMNGGRVEQLYKSGGNTSWHIDGGELVTGRGVSGTGYIMGGASVVVALEDTSATLPTAGTLVVSGGAKVKWRGGDVTALVVGDDGIFDASDADVAFTIGTLSGTAKALAKCKLDSKYVTVTKTTTNEYVGSRTALYSFMGNGG